MPNDTIASLAATHLEAVEQLQKEHRAARVELDTLRAERARLTAKVELQESELTRLQHENRFYLTFSCSLVVRLSGINEIIQVAMREAEKAGIEATKVAEPYTPPVAAAGELGAEAVNGALRAA